MPEIVNGDPNLTVKGHSPHGRSKVPFSNHVAGTYRFGHITPHFVAEVVNNDKFPLRSVHNIRSYNLKAPLNGNINLHKNYFQVPMESILPLNWKKVYDNPVRGDDVIASDVNCVITNVVKTIYDFFQSWRQQIANYRTDSSLINRLRAFRNAISYLICYESIFSSGSVASSLGIHLNAHARYTPTSNTFLKADYGIDYLYSLLRDFISDNYGIVTFTVDGVVYTGVTPDRYLDISYEYKGQISFSRLLDKLRDYPWCDVSYSGGTLNETNMTAFMQALDNIVIRNISGREYSLNLSRLLAYQLVCSHFYTNDKIDFVYSAELYRQAFSALIKNNPEMTSVYKSTFTMNGIEYPYDWFSGYYLQRMFSPMGISDLDNAEYHAHMIRYIFGYNYSLRFLDYFTGSKTQPLAIGDSSFTVSGGVGQAIDVTRSIQMQRFLNFVNRTGAKFEEYVSKLTGKYVAPDWHDPKFIGGTSDIVYSSETEATNVNPSTATATDVQTTISNFRSNASKFAFDVEFDRPSIVIGLIHFDIERYYSLGIERQNYAVDRFDMFNPFLQTIGDQPLYGGELDAKRGKLTFGYSLRHLEYKNRPNYCFGAVGNGSLPGWFYLADVFEKNSLNVIDDEYIRSHPSELDYFFISLTSYDLANYFHFIIDNYNVTEPVRPMLYAPEIL